MEILQQKKKLRKLVLPVKPKVFAPIVHQNIIKPSCFRFLM